MAEVKALKLTQFSCWRPHQKVRWLEPSRGLSRSGRTPQAPVKHEALGRFGKEEKFELITLFKDLFGCWEQDGGGGARPKGH